MINKKRGGHISKSPGNLCEGTTKPRGIRVDLGDLMHRSPRIFIGILDEIVRYMSFI